MTTRVGTPDVCAVSNEAANKKAAIEAAIFIPEQILVRHTRPLRRRGHGIRGRRRHVSRIDTCVVSCSWVP